MLLSSLTCGSCHILSDFQVLRFFTDFSPLFLWEKTNRAARRSMLHPAGKHSYSSCSTGTSSEGWLEALAQHTALSFHSFLHLLSSNTAWTILIYCFYNGVFKWKTSFPSTSCFFDCTSVFWECLLKSVPTHLVRSREEAHYWACWDSLAAGTGLFALLPRISIGYYTCYWSKGRFCCCCCCKKCECIMQCHVTL